MILKLSTPFFLLFSTLTLASPLLLDSHASHILLKDVAIIGAGASGSYAAVRLKEDYGKSIVVIEKAAKLGGHVSTYYDPATDRNFDFGVQSYNDYGPARDFFERLGIEVAAMPRVPLTSRYVDFTTGQSVAFIPPANEDRIAALQAFLAAVAPFEDMLLPGYFNFPDPANIPADLLLPFGEFVEKYQLHAAVNQIFSVTGFGTGDMVNELTLYVLGAFGAPMIRTFLGQAAILTPASGRNIEVYEKIAQRLGSDVLYTSTVVQSLRTPLGVKLWVKNHSTGKYTLVLAKKLLIAVEPTPENTAALNLSSEEKKVFGKFKYSNAYAGIVSHPSLPVDVSLVNLPPAAAPSNYLALPQPDFTVRFDYMGYGSNLFRVVLIGDENFSNTDAQNNVRTSFQNLVNGGALPATNGVPLEFKAWSNHGAMHARVSAKELKKGFIQDLYDLQGKRATWWTGGAFSVQFQSVLWAFDDVILPQIVGN